MNYKYCDNFGITVSIDPEEFKKLNFGMPESSLEKYFDYYKTEDIGEKKGKQKARCRICNKELARTGGNTGGMTKHLMGPHEEFYKIYEAARQNLDLKNKRISQPASSSNQVNLNIDSK
jgi:hypothetical protein